MVMMVRVAQVVRMVIAVIVVEMVEGSSYLLMIGLMNIYVYEAFDAYGDA
jgi:hypothetical protein